MDLNRFIKAQQNNYIQALAEVRDGRKRSHWMWFIFPQLKGLGSSETANYYGIKNGAEATANLQHPVLSPRLIEISKALLDLQDLSATEIFGHPDDLKLHSSMTLFSLTDIANPVFNQILEKYFSGAKDQKTLGLLKMRIANAIHYFLIAFHISWYDVF